MAGGRLRRLSCLSTYTIGLLLGVFLHNVAASGGKQVIHKKVGDSVEISSNLPTEGVSRAVWKYGDSKVADQSLDVIENNPFQARMQFNNVNFSLTIRDLTLQDSGDFSFISSANDKQRPTVFITLEVHEPISKKPDLNSTISKPDSKGVCTVYLECRAASHSNISYTWTVGKETYEGHRLEHKITLQDGDTTFTCTASNVVSEMSAKETVTCRNNTDLVPSEGKFPLQWILGVAGGGLLLIIIIIIASVCLSKRRWSGGSDSNELTVYADISDFSPEVSTSADSKPCSLYDTIENKARPGQTMPQTIYDKIQIERMRKASVSPYQEVS
ncbi:T-cell surface antigen CD2-like [Fundulus heteroclitus]|uniref:T-cell surface antigen CD2-like n=1 Tax=Fundulus heteroclitus TaxID=8078 RepID=UPI00165B2087|nr:T-cell surface antigen CD2-like [Fundulus heteroclitus]